VKLSLAQRLDILRYAPPGRRLAVTRKISDALQQIPPAPAPRYFDVGEFRNWEEFETKYRQLAAELGHPGKVPAPGEVEFLHRMVDRDAVRYPGGIGSRDYFFLTCIVSILAPTRVVEIGTLTGFSTAIIAAAIYHQHGERNKITVETIDSHTRCSIDESRPIGFEIAELVPDLVPTVRVHTGRESDLVREIAMPGGFGLAFIDADHRHPWPLLDVLRLAPCVEPRGWIVLHDIQLGSHGEAERAAGRSLDAGTPYGAEWLFQRWPFRKIRSFHIGAIEMPARKDALIPLALRLMNEPFEITGKSAQRIRRELYRSFMDLV
jgi:predicted O-methyltransferase YrrM